MGTDLCVTSSTFRFGRIPPRRSFSTLHTPRCVVEHRTLSEVSNLTAQNSESIALCTLVLFCFRTIVSDKVITALARVPSRELFVLKGHITDSIRPARILSPVKDGPRNSILASIRLTHGFTKDCPSQDVQIMCSVLHISPIVEGVELQ